MYTYEVWIRLNPSQTAHVRITASNDWECRMIAEAQYGEGMVLNYTRLNG